MHTVYILYSNSLDKYYVGESVQPLERLNQHNQGYYDSAFTKGASDWQLKLSLEVLDQSHAKRVEKHIKSMKSRVYIENLLRYKEMQVKLVHRFK